MKKVSHYSGTSLARPFWSWLIHFYDALSEAVAARRRYEWLVSRGVLTIPRLERRSAFAFQPANAMLRIATSAGQETSPCGSELRRASGHFRS